MRHTIRFVAACIAILALLPVPARAAAPGPVVTHPANNSAQPESPTFRGQAFDNATEVQLFRGTTMLTREIVIDGEWTIAHPFTQGTHTVRFRSLGATGPSEWSKSLTFRVDTERPSVHIFRPSGYLLVGRLIGEPVYGRAYDNGVYDSGVARVELVYTNLLTDEVVVRTASCAACPAFVADFEDWPPFSPGVFDVTARVYDLAGNRNTDTLTMASL